MGDTPDGDEPEEQDDTTAAEQGLVEEAEAAFGGGRSSAAMGVDDGEHGGYTLWLADGSVVRARVEPTNHDERRELLFDGSGQPCWPVDGDGYASVVFDERDAPETSDRVSVRHDDRHPVALETHPDEEMLLEPGEARRIAAGLLVAAKASEAGQ